METRELKELIEAVNNTDYSHVEIKHEGTYVLLQKGNLTNVEKVSTSQVVQKEVKEPIATEDVKSSIDDNANCKEIKSPIVGTFYESPSPDAEAYVKVGDKVKKGDVLCIIEAMKLMNEIESDCDGEIVEISVKNESPIEYGQVLFKIK